MSWWHLGCIGECRALHTRVTLWLCTHSHYSNSWPGSRGLASSASDEAIAIHTLVVHCLLMNAHDSGFICSSSCVNVGYVRHWGGWSWSCERILTLYCRSETAELWLSWHSGVRSVALLIRRYLPRRLFYVPSSCSLWLLNCLSLSTHLHRCWIISKYWVMRPWLDNSLISYWFRHIWTCCCTNDAHLRSRITSHTSDIQTSTCRISTHSELRLLERCRLVCPRHWIVLPRVVVLSSFPTLMRARPGRIAPWIVLRSSSPIISVFHFWNSILN